MATNKFGIEKIRFIHQHISTKTRRMSGYFWLLIAVSLLFYYFMYTHMVPYNVGVINCGSNINCFEILAPACHPATLSVDENGNEIKYSTTNNCVLVKEYGAVSSNEDKYFAAAVSGIKMSCPYASQSFDINWLSSIRSTQGCSGALKDVLDYSSRGTLQTASGDLYA